MCVCVCVCARARVCARICLHLCPRLPYLNTGWGKIMRDPKDWFPWIIQGLVWHFHITLESLNSQFELSLLRCLLELRFFEFVNFKYGRKNVLLLYTCYIFYNLLIDWLIDVCIHGKTFITTYWWRSQGSSCLLISTPLTSGNFK